MRSFKCSQFELELMNITKDGISIQIEGQLSIFRLRPCPCCIAAGFSPERITGMINLPIEFVTFNEYLMRVYR